MRHFNLLKFLILKNKHEFSPHFIGNFMSKSFFDSTLDCSLTGKHFIIFQAKQNPVDTLNWYNIYSQGYKPKYLHKTKVPCSSLDDSTIFTLLKKFFHIIVGCLQNWFDLWNEKILLQQEVSVTCLLMQNLLNNDDVSVCFLVSVSTFH